MVQFIYFYFEGTSSNHHLALHSKKQQNVKLRGQEYLVVLLFKVSF